MGSGNTCGNNVDYALRMVDGVVRKDTRKHTITFKMQLFQSQPPNIPLDWYVFDAIYRYVLSLGYTCTASVFDLPSLEFLLKYEIPFVKIACRPDLYYLIGHIPRGIRVVVSTPHYPYHRDLVYKEGVTVMVCVPSYPAHVNDYPERDGLFQCLYISDHTIGLNLWYTYQPLMWEKHLVLEYDDRNPDAGPFASTPEELGRVL
jgi:sialic acid synthase SpsE